MSYQVLARKWRPRTFRDLVGQEHVLQALVNALDHDRLHHAYLFTGTRGVGKTTIARILAKCLNCETGVSSTPCGQCGACLEIAENRFVDLIEVDAASRTKVEDTRELLENVQYAPTRGRYKVYLIDEVHMLSAHSFNALLKTLEEPPPHVKFLLATTDPQKLPVTILSRCLQFNLKNMTPELIAGHLQHVLEQELVPFEEAALWQLGRAADGSMRDALSLTDQAIAFGSGKVTAAEVGAMLGTIDRAAVYAIIRALVASDGKAALDAVAAMAEQAPDYASALADILSILHRIAIGQALPEAVDNSQGDRDDILQLAQSIAPEDVQLFYQTALLGRRDLPLAPDSRAGLEMVLLRMLAFRPQGVTDIPKRALTTAPQAKPELAEAPAASPPAATAQAPNAPEPAPEPQARTAEPQTPAPEPQPQAAAPHMQADSEPPVYDEPPPIPDQAPPYADEDRPPWEEAPQHQAQAPVAAEPVAKPEPVPAPVPEPKPAPAAVTKPPAAPAQPAPVQSAPAATKPAKPRPQVAKISLEATGPECWPEIYLGLGVGGVLQSTASNCELVACTGNQLQFVMDETTSSLYDPSHQQRLADALREYYGQPVSVAIEVGAIRTHTPAGIAKAQRAERQAEAVASVHNDPIVQQLISHFDAMIDESSIEPVDPE
ncbi:MAG TPA: DNA polymerase III subunit gamma/tau [Cellvibrionaceae bacterium]